MLKVGDVIRNNLHNTWGIRPCQLCHRAAKEMNEQTPQKIREDIEQWSERLHQNARTQNWIIRAVDSAAHATTGNAIYRKIILDACDYVERENTPCKHRGRSAGLTKFNRKQKRFRCECDEVEYDYCILAPMGEGDIRKAPSDGVAICSQCPFNSRED